MPAPETQSQALQAGGATRTQSRGIRSASSPKPGSFDFGNPSGEVPFVSDMTDSPLFVHDSLAVSSFEIDLTSQVSRPKAQLSRLKFRAPFVNS